MLAKSRGAFPRIEIALWWRGHWILRYGCHCKILPTNLFIIVFRIFIALERKRVLRNRPQLRARHIRTVSASVFSSPKGYSDEENRWLTWFMTYASRTTEKKLKNLTSQVSEWKVINRLCLHFAQTAEEPNKSFHPLSISTNSFGAELL